MKTMNGLRVALGVAIAAVSISAWAQDGASAGASAGTASAAVTASDGMTAKAARQANRALRRKVYAALAKHKEIDAGDISITAKGGAVLITGTVPDASQINTVAEVAKGGAGVTSVTSKLTVQRPFGQ
ncbi:MULTISPECIES: BON domain-containing protein [Paraburkholderia]|uniref:BON domain-containing protein n=1 Tax=Paraburkholderia TaxID=1822464 RepID=UPI0022575351|nr:MULTISPECIES: BON domain-containing protein [Paraburkholderia]MCX4177152.1 BON domain-containing protein [Paraburkholderia madseniana]MDQ6465140.1 BON domain-containing protein [Paraburkholderia madseniana]